MVTLLVAAYGGLMQFLDLVCARPALKIKHYKGWQQGGRQT